MKNINLNLLKTCNFLILLFSNSRLRKDSLDSEMVDPFLLSSVASASESWWRFCLFLDGSLLRLAFVSSTCSGKLWATTRNVTEPSWPPIINLYYTSIIEKVFIIRGKELISSIFTLPVSIRSAEKCSGVSVQAIISHHFAPCSSKESDCATAVVIIKDVTATLKQRKETQKFLSAKLD